MQLTKEQAVQIAKLADLYFSSPLREIFKWSISGDAIIATKSEQQIDYDTAAFAEYLLFHLNQPTSLTIDPTWTRITIKALECKRSSTGNITWQAEITPASARKLYIRQANKQLFLDAGYADLEKMQPGDFATCEIVVYVLPDGDTFWKPMYVIAGGTLALPAPFTDPFADNTPSPLAGDEISTTVGTGLALSASSGVEPSPLPASGEGQGVGFSPSLKSERGLGGEVGLWVKSTDKPKVEIIRRARDLLARGTDLLVGDTETTGAQMDDSPVSLAFVNIHEDVVLDLRVCPPHPEYLLRPGKNGKTASAINGFTPDQVRQFPPVNEIKDRVKQALYQKSLVTYNLEFDLRMLDQVSDGYATSTGAACLMLMYAQYRGKPNQYGYKGYAWAQLSEACEEMKIPTADLHHALGDSILALRLLKALAAVEIVE